MKTYLLEAYDPTVKFDKGSIIVALTPEVCYQLDRVGIKYSIIEDYYDEVQLASTEDEYLKSILEWLSKLDAFLQNHVPELKKFDLKLGIMYFQFLFAVLGPLILRCLTLRMLFDKIKPSNIVFVSHPPRKRTLDFRLWDDSRSLYSQIIPILCNERNTSLESIHIPAIGKHTRISKKYSYNIKYLKMHIKRMLGKYQFARNIYFFLNYGKEYPPTGKNKDCLNILLLVPISNYNLFEIVKSVLKKGHNLYSLSYDGDRILKCSRFGAKTYLDIHTGNKNEHSNDWKNAADVLEKDELISWIDEKCQMEVSQIILPNLKYFVSKVCPEIFAYFKFFIEFYEKENIHFVITPYEWLSAHFAAIAAANYYDKTVSVSYFHGDGAFDAKGWVATELVPYRNYICSNKEHKEYFECLCKLYNLPTKLFYSPHRLLNVVKIKNLRDDRRNKHSGSKTRERIIYLPLFFLGDHRPIGGAEYPDVWYYKFQKALIEYFSTKKEYVFVWKGIPSADVSYNPIPDFIKDKNFENIEIATNPFVEHLYTVDRVICDCPSTGFYESVVAGVPTISLYHKATKIRKTALEQFGNMLQMFSNDKDAVKIIEKFLNDDPELYKRTIDMGDKGIIEIIESLRKV